MTGSDVEPLIENHGENYLIRLNDPDDRFGNDGDSACNQAVVR